MTDLSKGIIEIEGFEISASTTSNDIEENLKDACAFSVKSKNGRCEIFVFKKVFILDNCFDIDITFIGQKLSDIRLTSNYSANFSYEERFVADCEWLKSILGEPTETNDDGNSYYFENIHLYSFIQRDLSRNPAETFIVCKYGR